MATVTTTRKRLSPHFVIEEFDCDDAARTRVPAEAIPALVELCVHMLEPLRAKYGPCTVNSGFRTVARNGEVGGARDSHHLYMDRPGSVAADVTFEDGTVAEWAISARWRFKNKRHWSDADRGGVGAYPARGFVHVDSGPRRVVE